MNHWQLMSLPFLIGIILQMCILFYCLIKFTFSKRHAVDGKLLKESHKFMNSRR